MLLLDLKDLGVLVDGVDMVDVVKVVSEREMWKKGGAFMSLIFLLSPPPIRVT